MIRGLDDDDIDHLDLVDKKRMEEEKLHRQEEMKELREYREKVAAMQEENEDKVSTKLAAMSTIPTVFIFLILEIAINCRKIPKVHRETKRTSVKTNSFTKVNFVSSN